MGHSFLREIISLHNHGRLRHFSGFENDVLDTGKIILDAVQVPLVEDVGSELLALAADIHALPSYLAPARRNPSAYRAQQGCLATAVVAMDIQPFITYDNQHLYFASTDGTTGTGFSIFRCDWTGSEWGPKTEVLRNNVGEPSLVWSGQWLYFVPFYFDGGMNRLEADVWRVQAK